jgi:hypothetical protein
MAYRNDFNHLIIIVNGVQNTIVPCPYPVVVRAPQFLTPRFAWVEFQADDGFRNALKYLVGKCGHFPLGGSFDGDGVRHRSPAFFLEEFTKWTGWLVAAISDNSQVNEIASQIFVPRYSRNDSVPLLSGERFQNGQKSFRRGFRFCHGNISCCEHFTTDHIS